MQPKTNYNDFADTYGQTRTALPWILARLSAIVEKLPPNSVIVEAGCGTGNYVIALAKKHVGHKYFGFDLSEEMLKIAQSRQAKVEFCQCNADEQFTYKNDFADMVFCVDVVHHLTNLNNFFRENYRILKRRGTLTIVTDSQDDIRGRALSHFFPEVIEVELQRYPSIEKLYKWADTAGFKNILREKALGYMNIDNLLIEKAERKFSSALRLISDSAHKKGIKRLKDAQSKGQKWLSRYTVLHFET